jgi:undecaprenyl-diphosphatase
MLTEYVKAIIFGLIEGITEWLPISSTGHLILFDRLLALNVGTGELAEEYRKLFDVVIQLGAILAVPVIYRKRLSPLSRDGRALWARLIIATIPAALIGLWADALCKSILGAELDTLLFRPTVVASALIAYGLLFIIVEHSLKCEPRSLEGAPPVSARRAFAIGCFQALALVPGTSRSGATILGAMLIGFSRTCGAEFSFFMGIPAMVGGSLIKAIGFFEFVGGENSTGAALSVPADVWIILAVSTVVAFAVSMIAIKFLMNFVKKHSFAPFGIYRIALGAIVLAYFAFKG